MPDKSHRRKASVLAAVVLLMGLCVRSAMGYALEGPSWQGATTSFDYAIPSSGGFNWGSALQQAMGDWNSVTSFTYVPVNQFADPCNDSAPNGAAFGSTDCGQAFGSGVLAITSYSYDPSSNQFIHAGIVFNSNVNFSIYSGPELDSPTDFRRVAVHELGHALGMAHENNSSIPAIMAPTVSNIETPTADDIAGVDALYGSTPNPVSLVSAVLPSSRSVQVGKAATAFATIINTGTQTATGCSIARSTSIPANFSYQATNSATNAPTGSPNQPTNIPPNSAQSFVFAVTPTGTFNPTDVAFNMSCSNSSAPAPTTTGLNTLLLSSSSTPTPDIVTLTATVRGDGYVHISGGSGAFAVATSNVSVSGTLTASADTGTASLPVTLNVCQTNPSTGACLSPPQSQVQVTIGANQTPTFAVFVSTQSTIANDPANNRIFIRFRDAGGNTRGSSSVAVTTG